MGSPIKLGYEMEEVHRPKINFSYQPLLIHIIICIAAGILSTINNSTGEWMMGGPITSVVYVLETALLIGLYFFFGRKFLTGISIKALRNTCILFFTFNLLLVLLSFSLMSIGTSDVMVENSQVPLILLIYLNMNWFFINLVIPTPAMISYLFISLGSPLLLYISGIYSKKVFIKKELINNKKL